MTTHTLYWSMPATGSSAVQCATDAILRRARERAAKRSRSVAQELPRAHAALMRALERR